ncbi:hypothetical protein GF406_24205 [candidate division KSB1 bacterium]|nr:hypothetical protein [candidate division KSB1 bacterium]
MKRSLFFICLSILFIHQSLFADFDPWRVLKQFNSHQNLTRLNFSQAVNDNSYLPNFAWHERVNIECFLDMFIVSGQDSLLYLATERIDNMLNRRDDNRKDKINSYKADAIWLNKKWHQIGLDTLKSYPVWSNFEPFHVGNNRQGHITSAYILASIGRFCHIVRTYSSDAFLNEKRIKYIKAIKKSIDHLEWSYVSQDTIGYYFDSPQSKLPTAWNMMAQAAITHFYLGKSDHFDSETKLKHTVQASQIANYFKSELQTLENDSYAWYYYPLKRLKNTLNYPIPDYWWEDVPHAGSELQMIILFYKHQFIFTDKTFAVHKLVNTLVKNIINSDHTINAYINGTFQATSGEKHFRKLKGNTDYIRLGLAYWCSLPLLDTPWDISALTKLYTVAETFKDYPFPGTAHMLFFSRLSTALYPKNLNLHIRDENLHTWPAFWRHHGMSDVKTIRNNNDAITFQKMDQNDSARIFQRIPRLDKKYRLTTQKIKTFSQDTTKPYLALSSNKRVQASMSTLEEFNLELETTSAAGTKDLTISIVLPKKFNGKITLNPLLLEIK